MLILPTEIPLTPIDNDLTRSRNISLKVLRLDMLDHYAGGNKYFKLKHNLKAFETSGHKKLLTFGGAWSNHLAAVAAAIGKKAEVIAVVRGEEPATLSDTLRFCQEKGMCLHFVSREDYRKKNEEGFLEKLQKKFGDFYHLPEGGSNDLAVKGCAEIPSLIKEDFDIICCPVGSGGTLAGIACGLHKGQQALGFVALKNGEYLREVISKLMPPLSPCDISPTGENNASFDLVTDYHFGGFAKTTPELLKFKKEFEQENKFELDFVYTSKMFFGIYDLIRKDHFKPGSKIIAVHTGGLQGNPGFTE